MKDRGDWLCSIGIVLITVGVALLSIPWALITLGGILFAASVYGAMK